MLLVSMLIFLIHISFESLFIIAAACLTKGLRLVITWLIAHLVVRLRHRFWLLSKGLLLYLLMQSLGDFDLSTLII